MDEETAKLLVSRYFEKNNLELLSVLPIYERGDRIMCIEFSCDTGIYHMKLYKDLRLFCQSKVGEKWIQIENY